MDTSNTITLKKKKKKRQKNTAQMKEQTRNTEVQINEDEIGKLPEKEFRIMIVKMIKNVENKMEKMQQSINKDLEELTGRGQFSFQSQRKAMPKNAQSITQLRSFHTLVKYRSKFSKPGFSSM